MECPDDLPSLPDMDRLTQRVSEVVQKHAVDCADVTMAPLSPDTTPSKPSIIEALKYVWGNTVCVCGVQRSKGSSFSTTFSPSLHKISPALPLLSAVPVRKREGEGGREGGEGGREGGREG